MRQPANLNKLVEEINKLDWYSAREEGLGDLYEGLLEKNANETKSAQAKKNTQTIINLQIIKTSLKMLFNPVA